MSKNQTGTDDIEFDLLEIGRVLLHRAGIIILSMVLVAAAAFGITYFLITPTYTSSALMYVNNSTISVGSTTVSVSASELSAAQSLVNTYGVILKSRMTLEEVIDVANLPYTYDELYDMVQTKSVNSTEIFTIDVTSTKPAEAEYIANTIAGVLPDKISAVVDGSDVRIVDYAVVPAERTSPSYTKNTVIGALVGFLLAAAIVIAQYMLDEYIRTEDYLAETYSDIPLLAVIPLMSPGAGKGKGGYYQQSQAAYAAAGRGAGRAGSSQKTRSRSERAEPASRRRRDEDERPAAKSVRREEPQPRRRRDEDDDDRPTAKSVRREEPATRKRSDEDDDDRPAAKSTKRAESTSRKRSEERDDDDDRPAAKSTKSAASKKSSATKKRSTRDDEEDVKRSKDRDEDEDDEWDDKPARKSKSKKGEE